VSEQANDEESAEVRIDRLRRATDAVRPRADLGARVLAAIESPVGSVGGVDRRDPPIAWLVDASRAARTLLPLAALVAALGALWAVRSARAWDQALTAWSATEGDGEW
jgi:hypothetical protein